MKFFTNYYKMVSQDIVKVKLKSCDTMLKLLDS